MILEYKVHRVAPEGVTVTPPWIVNGGFEVDPVTKTKIGFSPSAANRSWKIPDDVVVIADATALKARAASINDTYPYLNDDGSTMTNTERDQYVDDIITNNDIA